MPILYRCNRDFIYIKVLSAILVSMIMIFHVYARAMLFTLQDAYVWTD